MLPCPDAASRPAHQTPDVVEMERRINEQYDTTASMEFYKMIMGGGGDDMHFGIFNTGEEDLASAAQNSINFMANLVKNVSALGTSTAESVSVLDVGAGKGGSARFLAKAFGCCVTCLNLGDNQNAYNLRRAREDGLEELISVKRGSFNEPMPEDWSSSFDVVWVQESLCHAVDKQFVLKEINRVLKPGGALVFSDIMKGDDSADLSTFTEHNVSKELATPEYYRSQLPAVGIRVLSYHDLTNHLTAYFKLMMSVVTGKREELLEAGVPSERIEAYVSSLDSRFAKVESREFAWGVFVGLKEENFDSIKAAVAALEKRIQEQYDTDVSMIFYKYIMGGGGDNMHYGIFNTGKEDLLTASHNAVAYMANLAAGYTALRTSSGSKMRVLDLGSGKGGTARFLAKTFGCHVTCFNLGENQNKYNLQKAHEEGISHLITVIKGSFNERLPDNWTHQYDLVWSQEALCHAANRIMLMAEVERVLKPGGTLVFSDIMKGEEFHDTRHSMASGAITAKLASPDEYTQAIISAGMDLSVYRDLTANLVTYFSQAARSVREQRVSMLNAGVPGYRLEAYLADLTTRLNSVQERAFLWGAFVAKKPAMMRSGSAHALLHSFDPGNNWMAVSSMLAEDKPDSAVTYTEAILTYVNKRFAAGDADDLHIGLFNDDSDTLLTSSTNMKSFLTKLATRISPLMAVQAAQTEGQRVRILMLDAKKGASARALAQAFGCHVTCLEASPQFNKENRTAADAAGIGSLISIVEQSSMDPLKAAWTSHFDLVWAQEVIDDYNCLGNLCPELQRVLKPGGALILSNAMQVDFALDSRSKRPSLVQLRAALDGAGLRVTKHHDLTQHYSRYMEVLDETLITTGDSAGEAKGVQEMVRAILSEVNDKQLEWGVLIGCNPHYNKCLLVGAGPLGGFAAWRLSACGISDITAKVLPTTPQGVKDMLTAAGCRLITDWEDVEASHFNIVMVATKTHWLARIAHEMKNFSLKWDHMALIYNGYVKIPAQLDDVTTVSVVVPQSFSFVEESPAKGVVLTSVANGNTGNPWTFPPRASSRVVVAQLKQAGVNAAVSSSYEDDQFLKFCVNNSANLVAVMTGRNCNDLTGKRDTRSTMSNILYETFDVLQADSKFAGLVPLERDEYIDKVVAAVAKYSHHKPSSLQHYEQKRLADVAGLNGFISSMSRLTNVPSPVNDFVARSADAMCRAHRRGIDRETWSAATELAAAARLLNHQGMVNSISASASARCASRTDKMLLPPFGFMFSEAFASNFKLVDTDAEKFSPEDTATFGPAVLRIHSAVYSARPDVMCIICCSPPHASALAACAEGGARFAGKTVQIPFKMLAGQEGGLAQLLSHPDGVPDVVFSDNGGVVVLGEDVASAFCRLCELERSCQVQLLAQSAGAAGANPASPSTNEWDSMHGESSTAAEWESHKRQLLKKPGEYARPAYYE